MHGPAREQRISREKQVFFPLFRLCRQKQNNGAIPSAAIGRMQIHAPFLQTSTKRFSDPTAYSSEYTSGFPTRYVDNCVDNVEMSCEIGKIGVFHRMWRCGKPCGECRIHTADAVEMCLHTNVTVKCSFAKIENPAFLGLFRRSDRVRRGSVKKTVDKPSRLYYNVDNKKRRVPAPGKDWKTYGKTESCRHRLRRYRQR